MKCWKCGAENPDQMQICSQCGTDLGVVAAQAVEEGDGTGGLIPYKNQSALIGYYLAVFSILPCIGMVLGIQGLRFVNAHPEARGRAHAWVGIIVGGLFGFGWLVATIALVLTAIVDSSRH